MFADLHIHSKYSRATSREMDIPGLTQNAQTKGLNIVGTGDFTHPSWIRELKEQLAEVDGTGLYKPIEYEKTPLYFMITTEVSTIFEFEGKIKKIHHVILAPNLATAEQINDRLAKFGDLNIDGRPTLNTSAPELVEEVMAASDWNEVFPAHSWTPWYSIFGAFSGFDRMKDCYQDMTTYIHAAETGLSSDPRMNWRISALDGFTLVSNSDAHSPWPWRMGREANVFDLDEIAYKEIIETIRRKDAKKFLSTIEVNPEYGKYHWTGHRSCGVSLSPAEAMKLGNKCPVCHKELTKGVDQRIEELADRPSGFRLKDATNYVHLLPLHEIISSVLGDTSLRGPKISSIYDALIASFGNEYSVLLDASREQLMKVTTPMICEGIMRTREGRFKVTPGYDGVYGRLILFDESEQQPKERRKPAKRQKSLEDFM